MKRLAPSILAADFGRLAEQFEALEAAGVDRVHIDVMDGRFVPNISIGFPVISSMRPCTKMLFDVHLMVEEPERYVKTAAEAGADIITVHAEACVHLHRALWEIHRTGCKAGAALNPSTPLGVLEYIARDVDQVLIMTVNPGFGGQDFIASMKDKISDCKKLLAAKGSDALIELDGGITLENAAECLEAGADILVSGSKVFRGNIAENVRAFEEIIGGYEL